MIRKFRKKKFKIADEPIIFFKSQRLKNYYKSQSEVYKFYLIILYKSEKKVAAHL